MENKTAVGERIATRRKDMGISAKKLCEMTGISSGNLSGIEAGKSLPSSSAVVKISRALKCSTDWLLTGEDYNSDDFGGTTITKLPYYDLLKSALPEHLKSPNLEKHMVTINSTFDLSEDEKELLDNYKRLDSRGRHQVHVTVYQELDRIEEGRKEQKSSMVTT